MIARLRSLRCVSAAAAALALAAGCSVSVAERDPSLTGGEDSALGHDAGADPDGGALEVVIGAPDAQTQAFVPLEPGGDVRLETFGQGGTHATLAVRCAGFGDTAFVDVALENLTDGAVVTTPPSLRPRPLRCDGGRYCELSPLYVLTAGLAEPEDKHGLRIRIAVEVRSESGLSASAEREGVLRMAFAEPVGPTFTCESGIDLPLEWRCNGIRDCLDGSDERDCEAAEFECGGGFAIPIEWRCDAEADCADGSDELACPET